MEKLKDIFGGVVLVGGAAAVLTLIIYLVYLNEKRWYEYKANHHCVRTQVIHGRTFTTETQKRKTLPNGKTGYSTSTSTHTEPDQVTWTCDGEVIVNARLY